MNNFPLITTLKEIRTQDVSKINWLETLAFLKESKRLKEVSKFRGVKLGAIEQYLPDLLFNVENEKYFLKIIQLGDGSVPLNLQFNQFYHYSNSVLFALNRERTTLQFLVFSRNKEEIEQLKFEKEFLDMVWYNQFDLGFPLEKNLHFQYNPLWGEITDNNHESLYWRIIQFNPKGSRNFPLSLRINDSPENRAPDVRSEAYEKYWSLRIPNRKHLFEIFKNDAFWEKKGGVTVLDLVKEFYEQKKEEVKRILPENDQMVTEERLNILRRFRGVMRDQDEENPDFNILGPGANLAQIILLTVNHPSRTHFGAIPKMTMEGLRQEERNCHYFVLTNNFDGDPVKTLKNAPIERLFNPNQLDKLEFDLKAFSKYYYYFGKGREDQRMKELIVDVISAK